MKIHQHKHFPPKPAREHSSGGVKSFASYYRIVAMLINAGELQLSPGECVSEIAVTENGLEFIIEEKK